MILLVLAGKVVNVRLRLMIHVIYGFFLLNKRRLIKSDGISEVGEALFEGITDLSFGGG